MNYIEKINNVISGLDLKKPIFSISILDSRINAEDDRWESGLEETSLVNHYINRHATRKYDPKLRKYVICSSDTIKMVEEDLGYNLISVFMACSPFDEPRRSKIYKSFCEVLRANMGDQEFKNSIFNIYEYYYNCTINLKITHSSNDVHRTNIYNLLCLMEKRYGQNGTQNN